MIRVRLKDYVIQAMIEHKYIGESRFITIYDLAVIVNAGYIPGNKHAMPRAIRAAIHSLRINGAKINGKTALIPICLSKNGVFIAATEAECLHMGNWFAKREKEHALARQAFTPDSLAAFKNAVNNPELPLSAPEETEDSTLDTELRSEQRKYPLY